MPSPFTKKRIYNPEDKDQYVDLNIIDTLILAHGSGSIYQKRFLNFLNHEANNRNVRIRTISHVDQDVEGNPTDTKYSGSIEVEELGEFSLKHGSGSIYQKHIDRLDPSDILWDFRVRDVGGEGRDEALLVFGRKAHRKRISGNDGFIDVERIDELVVLHGSGSIFRREIIRLNWDDAEFDGASDLVLADQQQDGFDPPYRLDPFQSIYNVGWKEEEDEEEERPLVDGWFEYALQYAALGPITFMNGCDVPFTGHAPPFDLSNYSENWIGGFFADGGYDEPPTQLHLNGGGNLDVTFSAYPQYASAQIEAPNQYLWTNGTDTYEFVTGAFSISGSEAKVKVSGQQSGESVCIVVGIRPGANKLMSAGGLVEVLELSIDGGSSACRGNPTFIFERGDDYVYDGSQMFISYNERGIPIAGTVRVLMKNIGGAKVREDFDPLGG